MRIQQGAQRQHKRAQLCKGHVVGGHERRLPRGEFVHETPKSPDVALLVVRLLLAHLWGEVQWSSHPSLSKLRAWVEGPPESHVPDLDVAVPIQEDVAGFDIPVQDPLLVQVLEPLTNLNEVRPQHLLVDEGAA